MAATPSKYITLVSLEGFEYVVLREAAYNSPTIKNMLNPQSGFIEAKEGRCVFPEISGIVLEKIAQYFQYWYKNKDKYDVPDMDIPPEICLQLLVAADYLGMGDSKLSRSPTGTRQRFFEGLTHTRLKVYDT